MTTSNDHDILIRLEGKVDGINERLDKVNGRVGEAEDEITALKLAQAKDNGKWSSSKWTMVSAIAVSLWTAIEVFRAIVN